MGQVYLLIYTEKLEFSCWCTGCLFLDDFNQFIKRYNATVMLQTAAFMDMETLTFSLLSSICRNDKFWE
jgi:hypothetical protein